MGRGIKIKVYGNNDYIQRMLSFGITGMVKKWQKTEINFAKNAFIEEIEDRIVRQKGEWVKLAESTQLRKARTSPEHMFHKWIESGTFLKQVKESGEIVQTGNSVSLMVGARDDVQYLGPRAKRHPISMYDLAVKLERGGSNTPARPLFRPAAKAIKDRISDRTYKTLNGISEAWGRGSVISNSLGWEE